MLQTSEPLNVLLAAIGTHGDINPFIAIGQAMRQRGHRVRMIANPYFAELLAAAEIEAIAVGTEQEHREIHADPSLWRPATARRMARGIARQYFRPVYDAIAAANEPGKTVLAYSTLAMGAQAAQETLGIPSVAVHLSPIWLGGSSTPPRLAGVPMADWVPPGVWRAARGLYRALSQPRGSRLRNRENGGAPAPHRIIGLFPAWFADSEPGWPAPARLTGFALFDQPGACTLDPELLHFLAAGPSPIAFTPGSGMWTGQRFFAEAVRLCAHLHRRGLLLSLYRGHLPRELPNSVRHVTYAPFGALLPRCAAVVHHGGIGTSARAMAAGIPQLLTPFAFDQFDNARRLCRLGVARSIAGSRFRADRAAAPLAELLASAEVSTACRATAARFPDPSALPDTCALIEAVFTQAGESEA